MTTEPASARTRIRRAPHRASYDRESAYAILDEALICHVAIVRNGSPVVLPTIHARSGDVLYLHGSPATGYVRDLGKGAEVCVGVTIVDGLVLARSAFHHTMNYRSVVVHGVARAVTDRAEIDTALRALVDHVVPERWEHLRPMTSEEIKKTAVLAMDLDEVSTKIRTGPPVDDDADLGTPIWAGVLPLTTTFLGAETSEDVPDGIEPPPHVVGYTRP